MLKLSVNGQPLGQRKIALAPNELVNAENEFTWDTGGLLQAEISPSDALEADNRAIINLPTYRIVQVAVFTSGNSPFATDLLSVLSSNPYVQTEIVLPGTDLDFRPMLPFIRARACPPSCALIPSGFSADLLVRLTHCSRHPLELATSGDALGTHARCQRAQSGHAHRFCPAIPYWLR